MTRLMFEDSTSGINYPNRLICTNWIDGLTYLNISRYNEHNAKLEVAVGVVLTPEQAIDLGTKLINHAFPFQKSARNKI